MMNFQNRRQQLFNVIQDHSVVLLHSGFAPKRSGDAGYLFDVNRNFYYLTGIDEENVYLLISKENNVMQETIYIKKADAFMEKWVGKSISREEAKAISQVHRIQYLDDLKIDLENFLHQSYHFYLDLEKDDFDKTKHASSRVVEDYPMINSADCKDIYPLIASMRMIKSKEEIEALRKAIQITNEGLENMLKHMAVQQKEYEMVAHYNYIVSKHNSTFSFDTIAASGEMATILHYIKNDKTMLDGELVLLDLGATHEKYCADISRTYPVNGRYTPRQKQFYDIVLKAQLKVIDEAKPGITIRKLNDIVKNIYFEELCKIGLITSIDEVNDYYYHGVGHSLGLDTHDIGITSEMKLVEGMVITNEPGLYIAKEKIGIRIEDDLLITKTGCEVLSKDILKSTDEIEDFIRNSRG